jgi:hypothetical protein
VPSNKKTGQQRPGPPTRRDKDGARTSSDNSGINIENLNYTASDVDALRRMAEVNPELAERIVDQRDRENQRENVSYRFGVVAASVLLIAILAFTFGCLAYVGFLATLGLIGVVLACALLVRVVLTGEWSETSWFGSLVHLLARALGSRTPPDNHEEGTLPDGGPT